MRENPLKNLLRLTYLRNPVCKLVFSPSGFSVQDNECHLLDHLHSYMHIAIGDSVDLSKSEPFSHTRGRTLWDYNFASNCTIAKDLGDCSIAGFFKWYGIMSGGTKAAEIYAAIASSTLFKEQSVKKDYELASRKSIIRMGKRIEAPIMLFWAEGLKKR